jgi:8-oxo-dGTP diphosphatase
VPEQVIVGMLVSDGRALLGLRAAGRRLGGCWALPGGHLEPGETPVLTLARELREELDIAIATEHAHEAWCTRNRVLVRRVWKVERWAGHVVNAAPLEHDRLGWFTGREVAKLRLAHPEDAALIQGILERGTLRAGCRP